MVRVAVDFDLALEKSTSFYDTELQLTFCAEFFNIFIHTEFQNPTTGRVTSFLRRSVESFRDEPRFECNDRSLLGTTFSNPEDPGASRFAIANWAWNL